jgi:hypothetical protein
MNFFNRFQGIFFSPQSTLKAVSEKPVWVDAFILLLILLTVYSTIVVPYALKDRLQNLKINVELQERLGKESVDRQIEMLENPSQFLVILTKYIIPLIANLIGLFVPSLFLLALGRLFSTEGNYKQVLSVYLHASFVDKIAGNALRLILILIRKSVMQTTTSLALFFPKLAITSAAFTILSQFDFFQLWLFGILSYGLSSLFKIELKKALILSYLLWFLKSLFYIVSSFISPQLR